MMMFCSPQEKEKESSQVFFKETFLHFFNMLAITIKEMSLIDVKNQSCAKIFLFVKIYKSQKDQECKCRKNSYWRFWYSRLIYL